MQTFTSCKGKFFVHPFEETVSYTHLDVYKRQAFNLRTFGDYHDLYLLTDVMLLADVFESFRDMALRDYCLDPVSYTHLDVYKRQIHVCLQCAIKTFHYGSFFLTIG